MRAHVLERVARHVVACGSSSRLDGDIQFPDRAQRPRQSPDLPLRLPAGLGLGRSTGTASRRRRDATRAWCTPIPSPSTARQMALEFTRSALEQHRVTQTLDGLW